MTLLGGNGGNGPLVRLTLNLVTGRNSGLGGPIRALAILYLCREITRVQSLSLMAGLIGSRRLIGGKAL